MKMNFKKIALQAVLLALSVTAYGQLLHKGKTLHVWHIKIKNENGELVSSVQVTNFIMKAKEQK